jgi:Lon protease-like protein
MELGLFPLGMALLPGERVPLHVFEPRYRELIAECLDTRREFGLVLEDDEGMREIGTTAAVVEETDGRSFRTARVSRPDERAEQPTPDEVERCLAAFRSLAAEAEAEPDEPAPDVESLAFFLAARVEFGPEVKQELLELDSERERVVSLAHHLDRARETMRWAKTARERAQTNGRVEPPE